MGGGRRGRPPGQPHGRHEASLPEQPVGVIRAEQLVRLLKTCEGRDFTSRRDTAIILLLVDTGMRRAECVGMTVDDVDLDQRMVWVLGKVTDRARSRLAARPLRPWTAICEYARSIDLRTCRTSGSGATDP